MNALAPHKFWLATLLIAVLLVVFSAPMLGFLRDEAAKHLAEIRTTHVKTQQALDRLNGDIATTRMLSGQIGVDEIEKSLAYVDRLQAVDMLERQAASARLDHFAYTVSPEQRFPINDPVIGVQELAQSTVSVKAEAPLDMDIYNFIDTVRKSMPGRLRLQELTLERIGSAAAPLAPDNLRMTADFEWVSNGVARQMADGR